MAGEFKAGEVAVAIAAANVKAVKKEKSSSTDYALSPAARLFHSPNLNCYIVAIMGCKTKINPAVVKFGLQRTLIKHPRFSSKLVVDGCNGREMKWEQTEVDLDDHVVIPNLDDDDVVESPDKFVEDYVSHLTTLPLDLTKPLWELHLLNVKTSDAEAVGVFKIHHSVGDGASLVSLLLACTRKSSDPEELPTVPVRNRPRPTAALSGGVFSLIWMLLKLIWNTLVDLFLFAATLLFLRDTRTPIKALNAEGQQLRRFVHRTVSFDDIKLVKTALNTTINDVVVGVTQAGLSKYLHRRYGEDQQHTRTESQKVNLPRNIRLRAAVLVNLRPTTGIQDLADLMAKGPKEKWGWGNWIGYLMLPLTISLQDDPLDHVRMAKLTVDRKKLSFEPVLTCLGARIVLLTLGVKVASWVANRVLFNTTLAFSNMVGPVEEISFYGHPISYLAPSVYGHPHALTIHFQSYCNMITISLAVDPGLIPDPHLLCDDLEDSLKAIKEAVVQKFVQKGPDTV